MASRTASQQGRIAIPSPSQTASLAKASGRRFVDSDGTSHARALAYQSVFVVLSGFVGLLGLASVLGIRELRIGVQHMASQLAPGPSGKLLEQAAAHGASGGGAAAAFGMVAALVAGTLAMAQLERSANRIAGVDDRPSPDRFLVAFGLAVSGGLLLALGAIIMATGDSVATGFGWTGGAGTAWAILRWPLGAVLVTGAIYVLFRIAPRRPIGDRRAVWAGAVVAVVLWVVFTAALALYLSVGGGKTYGSMIGIVALLLWSVLGSLALHLGLAVGYELESRVGSGTVRLPDSQTVRSATA